jgi:tetratricopeptide (TPR) repeat protein
MAEIYYKLGNLEKAFELNNKALELKKIFSDKMGIGLILGNIGNIYSDKKEYNKALEFYFKGMEVNKEIGNNRAVAGNLYNIARTYKELKNNTKALDFYKDAQQMALQMSSVDLSRDALWGRSETYENKGDYKSALKMYQRFMALKDSVNNSEKNKEVTKNELRYSFDKKAMGDSIKSAEKEKVTRAELKAGQLEIKQERMKKYFLLTGVLLCCVFSFFIYKKWRLTQNQNKIIAAQKHLVEEKQKEILDSIHYARRIQMAQMPSEKQVTRIIKKANKN